MSAGPIQFLAGPTAAGKTGLAHRLADRTGWAILSADSMLVYRGMEIGTDKPPPDQLARYRYGGVDLTDPDREFSAGAYRDCAIDWLRAARRRESGLLVVGGTGLYIQALLLGLDRDRGRDDAVRREAEARLAADGLAALQAFAREADPAGYAALDDPRNPRRLVRLVEAGAAGRRWKEKRPAIPVLALEPAALAERIERRVRGMYRRGLIGEARGLADRVPRLSETARRAIGYREAFAVLSGERDEESAIRETAARTRRLAKRQRTWFRHQLDPVWIDASPERGPDRIAEDILTAWETHGGPDLHGLEDN